MIESSDPDEKKDREIFFNDIPTSEVNKKKTSRNHYFYPSIIPKC